ncbi:BAHD acyltransferase At5g47980-like [Pyrus x bretschneideri]|uniref:BAHD acyltransferase At5g47980-like n=1 Tax=Pyrus x bretschneideri TaxID=225117 RepID=UPI0020309066|nr:BAHD acyltransferase At5g47980-like [Pyrus x bretschneideri]
MASDIKVEILHKETIKPSSPTPHHLKTCSLSGYDQLTPEIYVPLILFYPNGGDEASIDHHALFADRFGLLKRSLSEALTHFYPFAGEFVFNVSISCSDHGAGLIEAQVNCPISKILDKPDFQILGQLIPTSIDSKQAETGHLLLVQVSSFKCGGLAIGMSISHKVADASTLSAFIKSWTAIALGSAGATDHAVPSPEFGIAATIFPPQDILNSQQGTTEFPPDKGIGKRFVFDASKIAALKSKAASATVPNPTRVEVVSALIWKCAMEASRSNLGFTKPSVWSQVVNMRKRSGKTLMENILGNFSWYFAAMSTESEVDLEILVAKFRKGIEEYKEKYPNSVGCEDALQSVKEHGNILINDSIVTYSCSSWCRFPFYETNFGWGQPSWVSICSSEFKNTIILMDTSDGFGVEALLTFTEEDMAIIERHEDLLAYASVNPPVIN